MLTGWNTSSSKLILSNRRNQFGARTFKFFQNAATLETQSDWIFIAKELDFLEVIWTSPKRARDQTILGANGMAAGSGKELNQPPTRKQVRAYVLASALFKLDAG